MGLLVDSYVYRDPWSKKSYDMHRLNVRGKAVAWLGVVAAGFGIFSEQGLGLWGHSDIERSSASMNQEAHAKYQAVLQQGSPAQLFELRYTDQATINVARLKKGEDGSGIIGAMAPGLSIEPDRMYTIGDGCLNDTAYDINGGKLHFDVEYYGLFSSVVASASGDNPTAAAQAIYNPVNQDLTIKSGNTRSDNLNFHLTHSELEPMDQTTKNVLATYGCKNEVQYRFTNGDPNLS